RHTVFPLTTPPPHHLYPLSLHDALPISIHRLVAAGILVAMSLAMPKPARAGRLGADIIALFPKEIGEFAYADLKKARSQIHRFPDRKSTRLNSSHVSISYAVFCLKKKKK